MNTKPYTRSEKVMMCCIHHVKSLEKLGLADTGIKLSAGGQDAITELLNSEFKPTQRELNECLAHMMDDQLVKLTLKGLAIFDAKN